MIKPDSCNSNSNSCLIIREKRYALIYGDCIQYLPKIKNHINLLLTDIPYGEVNRSDNGLRSFDKGLADKKTFSLKQFMYLIVNMQPDSIYIFCGTEQVSYIRYMLKLSHYSTRLCIWEKPNPSPINGDYIWLSNIECCVFGKLKNATFNEHCKGTVWRYPSERGKLHPTQKPIKLIKYLIEVSSNINDTILDCCMGSNTTGLAALELGRRFIGIELDYEFFKVSNYRLNKWLNQTHA